jgi:hypothetical protein
VNINTFLSFMLYSAVSNSDYAETNYRMVNGQWNAIWKEMILISFEILI